MQVTMRQFKIITDTGVSPATEARAIHAWLSRRPYDAQRVLCQEMSSHEATAVVAALEKGKVKR